MVTVELWNEVAMIESTSHKDIAAATAYIQKEILPVVDEGDTIKIK